MPPTDPRCHHGRPAPPEAHVFKGSAALRAQRSLAAAWMAHQHLFDVCRAARGGARRRLGLGQIVPACAHVRLLAAVQGRAQRARPGPSAQTFVPAWRQELPWRSG